MALQPGIGGSILIVRSGSNGPNFAGKATMPPHSRL